MEDNDFRQRVIDFIAETSVTVFEASDGIRKEYRRTLGAIWLESEFMALNNMARELGIWKEVNARYAEIMESRRPRQDEKDAGHDRR